MTGTVSHYLCWILLNIGMNICYWTTGNCTGSLGEPPAQIWEMLIYGIAMTGASLLPKSLASKGYNYSQALDLLIESSINVDRS